MKRTTRVCTGIFLSVLCMFAVGCPDIEIISPVVPDGEDHVNIVQDSGPAPVDVEISVPVPGKGPLTFPVDPDSLEGFLTKVEDGEVLSVDDTIALGLTRTDHPDGTYSWAGTGTVSLDDFAEYALRFSISNEMGEGSKRVKLRFEQTVAMFQGAYYAAMTIPGMRQVPNNCFVNAFLWAVIRGIAGTQTLHLDIPSGAEIAAAGPGGYPLSIVLPGLGTVPVDLTLDEVNNDILMAGPAQADNFTLDLFGLGSQFGIDGFDCELWVSATGSFHDIDPDDVDGSLTVNIHDVHASPQGGTCTLSAADPCSLIVRLDMDP